LIVFATTTLCACGGSDGTGPSNGTSNLPAGATLSVVTGDGQSAFVGSLLPVTPQVAVRTAAGQPIGGITVSFFPRGGGGDGAVGAASGITDANGLTTPLGWRLGNTAGKDTLLATVNGLPSGIVVATATPSQFTITVRYVGGAAPSGAVRQAFIRAVNKWQSVIVRSIGSAQVTLPAGTCDGSQPAIDETVTDLLILVQIITLPGATLGQAGPCVINDPPSNLPVLGIMDLNSGALGELEQDDLLNGVVEHEFAHLLGFGTIWDLDSLVKDTASTDPWFSGPQAQAAFHAAMPSYMGHVVPVEETGGAGTALSHWRESVMTNELMTGFINQGINPLSLVTVGEMGDLGYVINPLAAEPWPASGIGGGPGISARTAPLPTASPAPHTAPLRGPIVVIDRAGRIVGTRTRPGS
jgi:hypothetical protein